MEEYERQNGPLPGNGDKVCEWLRNGETACSPDGQALPGSRVASESNATRCPAQGSTRLKLGIVAFVGWPAQLAQPTIAVGYLRTNSCLFSRTTVTRAGPASSVRTMSRAAAAAIMTAMFVLR